MPKIVVDGEEFDVPESVTGERVKETAKMDKDDVIYEIDKDGKHRIVNDNEMLSVNDGDEFGRIRPFTAGG